MPAADLKKIINVTSGIYSYLSKRAFDERMTA